MGEIAAHGVQLAADGKIPRHILNPPALGQIKIRDVEPVEADIVLRVDKRRARRREDHVICVVSGHQRGQRVRLIVARRQLVIEGNIQQLLHRLIAAENSVIECLTDLFLSDELLRSCIRAREDCEFISAVGQSLGKPQRLGRLRHGNRGGIGRRGCGIGGGRLPAAGCERRRERCDKEQGQCVFVHGLFLRFLSEYLNIIAHPPSQNLLLFYAYSEQSQNFYDFVFFPLS